MVHGKNRIPYWIDRRLTGLAGPEYDATISFGLPFESEDCPYGESRLKHPWLAATQALDHRLSGGRQALRPPFLVPHKGPALPYPSP